MGALLHKKMLDTCFIYDCARVTSTIVSNNVKVLRVYVNAARRSPIRFTPHKASGLRGDVRGGTA
jgi:hypothetical protein